MTKIRTFYSTNKSLAPENIGKPAALNEHGCAVILNEADGNYGVHVLNITRGMSATGIITREELQLIYDAIGYELQMGAAGAKRNLN